MDDITDLRAEALSHRLALEVLWTSFLQTDRNAISTARRLGSESAAIFRIGIDETDDRQQAFREAAAKHSESLWRSIEHRLQQERD